MAYICFVVLPCHLSPWWHHSNKQTPTRPYRRFCLFLGVRTHPSFLDSSPSHLVLLARRMVLYQACNDPSIRRIRPSVRPSVTHPIALCRARVPHGRPPRRPEEPIEMVPDGMARRSIAAMACIERACLDGDAAERSGWVGSRSGWWWRTGRHGTGKDGEDEERGDGDRRERKMAR
ncbi:uncharacterized protein BKA78DRAFT_168592 [Phyllosticta capitalensis]|uniref:uncharacterized protein n=1 Tax=Phyllosticta capitalensis TaxID=121624 RepID=UPI003131EFBD